MIVGYDIACEADEAWYEFQTQGESYKPTKQQPWYHVLVDGSTNQTYVAQQYLAPGDSTRPIDHPLVDEMFATFFGGRYHQESLT